MSKPLLTAAVLTLALAGCAKDVEAPRDIGVCYYAAPQKDGSWKFNAVKKGVPNLETCAAELEGMRLRFMRLGSPQTETVGSYQGAFLFLNRAGVFSGKRLEGMRYIALVRTGDGRLAIPGAMPQQ